MINGLLGGMDEGEFFARYWRRRFLHVPGGAGDFLPVMPTRADVEVLLDRPGHEDPDVVHFLTFPVTGEPVVRSWAAGRGDARLRDRREAVNLSPADRWFPALAPLASAMAATFGAPASLQLFWAPPGGGVTPHRDANDSFVVQIEGRKRWRGEDVAAGRPAVAGNGGGVLPSGARVFDLAPGDVLYKPSHAVHTTESAGQPTLSLTCSVCTRTAGDVLLDSLRTRLAADPVWLERLPLVGGPDGSDDDEARALLDDALARLGGRLPTRADLEAHARW